MTIKNTIHTHTTSKKTQGSLNPFEGNERVLVVDDEPFLVRAHKMQLTLLGYSVTTTTSSKEALEIVKANPKKFALLITDQIMPELSGLELAEEVLKINPLLPIILCTGQGDVVLREKAMSRLINGYVSKPIFGNELFQTIRNVLDGTK
jgi:CheY-like chemotaxis protein